jgi:hypothetical protein
MVPGYERGANTALRDVTASHQRLPARERCTSFAILGIVFADEFLPVYDVSDKVTTVVDAGEPT